MRPSPAKGQIAGGTVEVGEYIDVGKIGADEKSGGAVAGAPREPGPAQRGADQRVTDGIYGRLIRRCGVWRRGPGGMGWCR
jgi:hypothetical protein